MELFTLKPRTGPAESVALPGLSISATVYNEDAFRDHTQPPPEPVPSTQNQKHTLNLYIKKTRNEKLKTRICIQINRNDTPKFFAVKLCKYFRFSANYR